MKYQDRTSGSFSRVVVDFQAEALQESLTVSFLLNIEVTENSEIWKQMLFGQTPTSQPFRFKKCEVGGRRNANARSALNFQP